MSQLVTLIWLKWTVFRNSMQSRKAVVNRIASILGIAVSLVFALAIAVGLGAAAYLVSTPEGFSQTAQARAAARAASDVPPADFILFMIFSFLYLIWATVPLGLGSSSQFDPGRLLMYPISLRKLFALDLISELTSLASIFAVPAVFATGLGVGLRMESVFKALLVGILAAAFGIALTKWLATSIGALTRKRRTRGETLLALIGAIAGLSGAFVGQLAPVALRHANSFRALRWTPSGAVALALTKGLGPADSEEYLLALATLTAYTVILVAASYWIARRGVLGRGRVRRRNFSHATMKDEVYTGWEVPFLSADLSAVAEKELRYAMRNAQLRMMALMPLILLGIRLMNRKRFGGVGGFADNMQAFLSYGHGLMASFSVLYVFLILAGLACNQFAFEEGGMRSLILSPVERRKILVGKNLAISIIAFLFSIALIVINEIVFRDLTAQALLFVGLSFTIFAVIMSLAGNWLSIHFPRRMKFGKRMNVSGVAGLLIIPIIGVMAVVPICAVTVGYLAQSLLVEYVTLALFACFMVALYFLIVTTQGRSLERHEVAILEAVRAPTDD